MNTDLKTSELLLGKYDKKVYQKYQYCHQVIEIKKGFKENAFICNMCFKLLLNEEKTNPQIPLYGQKNKNIEFLQTSIVLFWIVYSDIKMSKKSIVKFPRKVLIFI